MRYRVQAYVNRLGNMPLRRHYAVIFVLCIVVLICGVGRFYMLRSENSNKCDEMVRSFTYEKENLLSEIEQLEKFGIDNFYLSDRDHMKVAATLSVLYGMIPSYRDAVDYSVLSIYYAKKCGDDYGAAWAYVDLANLYVELEAYDKAEATIKTALRYDDEILDKTGRGTLTVRQFANLNLAEVYSMNGENEKARKFLQGTLDSMDEEKSDDKLIEYSIAVIYGQILFNEGNYEACREVLDKIAHTAELEAHTDEFWRNNVVCPYWYLNASLSAVEGNLQMSTEAVQELARLYEAGRSEGMNPEFVTFLLELSDKDKNMLSEECQMMLAELLPKSIKASNQMTAQFIHYSHNSALEFYEANDRKSFLFISAIGGVFLALAMIGYIHVIARENRTDGLTGAYNRRYFDAMLKQCTDWGKPFGIVMFDIDLFKNINDTYGHRFGDIVLTNVCRAIQKHLSMQDSLYRYGGEEFCIISRQKDPAHCRELGENIRMEVEQMCWRENISVTISVGIGHRCVSESVLELADKNLYKAKRAGRNQVIGGNEAAEE